MFASILDCKAADPARARTGRVLAGILLIFTAVSLLSNSASLITGIQQIDPLSVITLLLLLVCYGINRRGAVTVASGGLVLALFGVVLALGLNPQTAFPSVVMIGPALVIPVALAGVLLSWRAVLGATLAASGAAWVFYHGASAPLRVYDAQHPNEILGAIFFTWVILWSVGGLSSFASSQIQQTLARLAQQNTDLAAQSAREQTLIAQMRTTAVQVRQAAGGIAAIAAQQAQGASEQAAAITQVSSTIEELDHSADQIAGVATIVVGAADQALQSVQQGQDAVQAGIAGMARITARIQDIVTRNLTLAAQSQQIEGILNTISEVAAQTHILALNAAIESAGAGAVGARFAVVAAEVKHLAQRSGAATRAIQEIIHQHQSAIAAAVLATEEGLKEGDAGLHLAEQSGTANARIRAAVEQATELAHTIDQATRQQRAASGQVVMTMREMVITTQVAAAGSQQTLTAVQDLDAAAEALGAGTHAE
jgi:methyl-accepting chemotaxis protein